MAPSANDPPFPEFDRVRVTPPRGWEACVGPAGIEAWNPSGCEEEKRCGTLWVWERRPSSLLLMRSLSWSPVDFETVQFCIAGLPSDVVLMPVARGEDALRVRLIWSDPILAKLLLR